MFNLYAGDCLETLKNLPDNSVDSIVTDPPYGLSFMGKRWDYDVPGTEIWAECLRVLKPGGHLLAFAGTRTQHRMAVRIEDAGFEIRDMIAWIYGSGFPKTMDVSKAIDKAAGAEREVVGERVSYRPSANKNRDPAGFQDRSDGKVTAPATEAARQWEGWGTALKPALEPITVARKPIAGTVAANVLAYGTGALNIDGCRVGDEPITQHGRSAGENRSMSGANYAEPAGRAWTGRWPANLIHDGSEEVLAGFPQSSGGAFPKLVNRKRGVGVLNNFTNEEKELRIELGDAGSAARFFYCAKASRADRNEGLASSSVPAVGTSATMREREDADWASRNGNHHPTVKPTDLMRYLCRLVTPPGGTVLDPFMGSGSTGKAAMLEGFCFIGCELSDEYLAIAKARIEAAIASKAADEAEKSPQVELFA